MVGPDLQVQNHWDQHPSMIEAEWNRRFRPSICNTFLRSGRTNSPHTLHWISNQKCEGNHAYTLHSALKISVVKISFRWCHIKYTVRWFSLQQQWIQNIVVHCSPICIGVALYHLLVQPLRLHCHRFQTERLTFLWNVCINLLEGRELHCTG